MYEELSDLAIYEQLRARFNFDDVEVQAMMGIDANTQNQWRRRNHVPIDKREKMLALLNQESPYEVQASDALRTLEVVRARLATLLRRER